MSTSRRRRVKRRHSTISVPQKPNQRNRAGRSGLDPMDNYRESGYIQGIILKQIFTGNLRTANPYFLIIMFGLGLLSTVTGHYIYVGTADTNWSVAILLMVPMVIFGLALLYNFGLNMWLLYRRSPIGKWWSKRHNRPKYRKSKTSR